MTGSLGQFQLHWPVPQLWSPADRQVGTLFDPCPIVKTLLLFISSCYANLSLPVRFSPGWSRWRRLLSVMCGRTDGDGPQTLLLECVQPASGLEASSQSGFKSVSLAWYPYRRVISRRSEFSLIATCSETCRFLFGSSPGRSRWRRLLSVICWMRLDRKRCCWNV